MDLCDLGASKLDPKTNAVLVQCQSAGVSEEDKPDYPDVPLMCALGVSAKPYQADESGAAQGLIDESIPGTNGAVVAARDTRSADVYAELSPGDTALHATGKDYQSQVRCQNRMVSIVTVDADDFNALIVVDGKNKKISIAGFGHAIEMSEQNGIVLAEEGGAAIIMKNGVLTLKGASIAIGEGAKQPVHAGFGAGTTSIPSMSVLVP